MSTPPGTHGMGFFSLLPQRLLQLLPGTFQKEASNVGRDVVPKETTSDTLNPLSKLLYYGIIFLTVFGTIMIISGIIAYCYLYQSDLFQSTWQSEEERREQARLQHLKQVEEDLQREREAARLQREREALERQEVLTVRAVYVVGGAVVAAALAWLCVWQWESSVAVFLQPLGYLMAAVLLAWDMYLLFKCNAWTAFATTFMEAAVVFAIVASFGGALNLGSKGRLVTQAPRLFVVTSGGPPKVHLSDLGHTVFFLAAFVMCASSLLVAIVL